jgi:hypothetical protein
MVSMRRALEDPKLLASILREESWRPWRILLIALMGEDLTDDERSTFRELTQREREPGVPVQEGWFVIGRRGGKTRASSVLAAYIAALCEHDLAPGERGVIPIMAASKQQAQTAFNYVLALFTTPPFDKLKASESADTIRLINNVEIAVRPASFRTIRGITAVAAIADEISVWFGAEEASANPDSEILNAVRPALATTGGPLIVISSPHARRGELWQTYGRHYGPNGDPAILVAQAPSRILNPTLPQKVCHTRVCGGPSPLPVPHGDRRQIWRPLAG